MYACMHACMHSCMHVCMYVCMYVRMHACMYACMYECVCMEHALQSAVPAVQEEAMRRAASARELEDDNLEDGRALSQQGLEGWEYVHGPRNYPPPYYTPQGSPLIKLLQGHLRLIRGNLRGGASLEGGGWGIYRM